MSKLVRDRIPEIIMRDGATAEIRHARQHERYGLLMNKLYEEIAEFQDADSTEALREELADIAEVLRALAFLVGESPATVEETRKKKMDERGGFNHGVILLRQVGP